MANWTAATTLRRVTDILKRETGLDSDDLRVDPRFQPTLEVLERAVLREAMGGR